MEFMIISAKNTVGAKEFLLSLAIEGNVTVVNKASDWMIGSHKKCISIQSLGE